MIEPIVAWFCGGGWQGFLPSRRTPTLAEKRKANKDWREVKHSLNPPFDPEIHKRPPAPGGSNPRLKVAPRTMME